MAATHKKISLDSVNSIHVYIFVDRLHIIIGRLMCARAVREGEEGERVELMKNSYQESERAGGTTPDDNI